MFGIGVPNKPLEADARQPPGTNLRAAHRQGVRLVADHGKTLGFALSLTNVMVIIPSDGAGEAGVRDCLQAGDRAPSRRNRGKVLGFDPDNDRGAVVATTNRKPLLRPSPFGENSFGPQNRLRVFYCSDPDEPRRVLVEAIGVKQRNRLTIGGQEVKYES